MSLAMKEIQCSYVVGEERFDLSMNLSELFETQENEHLRMEKKRVEQNGYIRHQVYLYPKTEIKNVHLEGIIPFQYSSHNKVYVNGYQSWTDSVELDINERMPRISPLAKPIIGHYALNAYGDYTIVKDTHKKGDFHGFTYSYIRKNSKYQLIGSVDESVGYTVIKHSVKNQTIKVYKDLEGVVLTEQDTRKLLMDIVFVEGAEGFCFDTYFSVMDIKKPRVGRMNGWTSWYNYYEDITEDIILHNLDAIDSKELEIDIFQIDDGYESYVGDWLKVDSIKFPNGMKPLAEKIHAKGYKAGIWLAPFVCETKSDIYKNKKSWLLKDEDGNPVKAGSNWSHFYALDIYNREVEAYIRHVFDVVLNEWNYDMVKLDFLYAISIIPSYNKSRGQIMSDGMKLLRECVGDKLILGCGVPLGPSFGRVDYCRIGCDVSLDWNDSWVMQQLLRERVSTYNAIKNSIYRRHLDNRAFMNDPDVFLLRNENIKLSVEEKSLLTYVNDVFGSLIFTSDDVANYDEDQETQFIATMERKDREILSVKEVKKDVISIKYLKNMKKYAAIMNLTNKDVKFNGKSIKKHSYIKEIE